MKILPLNLHWCYVVWWAHYFIYFLRRTFSKTAELLVSESPTLTPTQFCSYCRSIQLFLWKRRFYYFFIAYLLVRINGSAQSLIRQRRRLKADLLFNSLPSVPLNATYSSAFDFLTRSLTKRVSAIRSFIFYTGTFLVSRKWGIKIFISLYLNGIFIIPVYIVF